MKTKELKPSYYLSIAKELPLPYYLSIAKEHILLNYLSIAGELVKNSWFHIFAKDISALRNANSLFYLDYCLHLDCYIYVSANVSFCLLQVFLVKLRSLLGTSNWTLYLIHGSEWLQCSPMVQETGVQSQVKSYQRIKKWYLMHPCLAFSTIR